MLPLNLFIMFTYSSAMQLDFIHLHLNSIYSYSHKRWSRFSILCLYMQQAFDVDKTSYVKGALCLRHVPSGYELLPLNLFTIFTSSTAIQYDFMYLQLDKFNSFILDLILEYILSII